MWIGDNRKLFSIFASALLPLVHVEGREKGTMDKSQEEKSGLRKQEGK